MERFSALFNFMEFLKLLDQKYPKGDKVRVILDNHSAHTSKETQEYLNLVSNRFEFVFTPTHGSWLQYGRRFLQNERSKSKVLAWNVIDRGMGCSRLVFNEGGN